MLKIKQSAKVDGISRELWYAAGMAAALFSELANADCVITSGTDGSHLQDSKHYKGFAIDLRTRNVGSDTAVAIFESLKRQLEPLGFDVVAEGTAGGAMSPFANGAHIHIEFDPKPGERFLHETT